jgi:outer membrane autotransporter protein
MTIGSVLLLPLEKDVAETMEAEKALGRRSFDYAKWVRRAAVGVVMWCSTQGAEALGQAWTDPPPKNGSAMVAMNKTQMVNATASFDFWDVNELWEPAQSHESDQFFRIRDQAAIKIGEGQAVHLRGLIANELPDPVWGLGFGLTKLGAGALTLSGHNTYEGNTLLLQGELQAASNDAFGPESTAKVEADIGTVLRYAPGVRVGAQLSLAAMTPDDWRHLVPAGAYAPIAAPAQPDHIQLVVDSGEAVQSGAVRGAAPVLKRGAGLLRLTSALSEYEGLLTVAEGALAVDGLLPGAVHVLGGARLQGAGVIGMAPMWGDPGKPVTIAAGGTLAPGNGLGSLLVQGDLVFEPGARFEVDVSASGAADAVKVEGLALLAGEVAVQAQAGDWQPSTRYELLSADLGFDKTTFSSVLVNQGFAFLTPALSYDDHRVYLTLARNGKSLDEVAETPNDDKVADALDDGKPPIYDDIIVLDEAGAGKALRQLSGSWSASVRSGLLEDTRFVRQAVYQSWPNLGFWSHAFHSSADRQAQGGVPGDDRQIQGLVLGANRSVGNALRVGVFAGAQHSGMRRALSLADAGVNSQHLGMNLAGQWRSARFTAGAAQSWHSIKSQRRVTVPGLEQSLHSRYRGRTTQLFGELSVGGLQSALAASDTEPFARLEWVRASMDGFAEQGGRAALDVAAARPSVLLTTLGLRMTRRVQTNEGTAQLQGVLAWRHASGTVQSLSRQTFRDGAGQPAFESEGQPLARSALQLELGMSAPLMKHARLSMGYAGQYASRMQDHGARLHLAIAF